MITSICFLLDNFDTTVMVKEVDEQSRFVMEPLPQILEFCDTIDGLVHSFEHTTAPTFHRQRVLNDMIMEAKTEIVVNYDCDIILPVESYLSAYNSILDNEADVVYPYGDGEYQYRVMADDELVSEFLSNDFDHSILRRSLPSMMLSMDSVSSLTVRFTSKVVWKMRTFVYALEDVERFYRFTTLGYSVGRIELHGLSLRT